MNRYPEKQGRHDADDEKSFGRRARLRPGDRVMVQGVKKGVFGPRVLGRVLLSRVSDVVNAADAVLVSTREYGRRWFHTQGHAFRVVEELD